MIEGLKVCGSVLLIVGYVACSVVYSLYLKLIGRTPYTIETEDDA